jgi:hypothetical protein
MSTDRMPKPPDQPTNQIPSGNPQTQDAAAQALPDAQTQAMVPFSLADSLADILESNADTIAQRLYYHSQIMYGVGAIGIDTVNARNAVLVLANALRNNATSAAENAVAHAGTAQLAQVNDATLPLKNNAQIAGLLEGLVLDTVSRAYGDDIARTNEARKLLNSIFQPVNDELQYQSRAMVNFQAPGPSPNARK